MQLQKEDLSWAAAQGLLNAGQADELWAALEQRSAGRPKFDAANVLYYFGALIIIGAMSFFMTLGWETFGGRGIFFVSAGYAVIFVLCGHQLWKREMFVPGGLLITVAVCMAPLAIYGLEQWTGFWPQESKGTYRDYHIWVSGSWIVMELGTILAALLALRAYPFPFLTAPIAFSMWYMSMDLTPLIFGESYFSWEQRKLVSAWFGLGMLLVSYVVDRRMKQDFSFWLYLFGLMIFWGALSSMDSGSELNRFIYCLINLGLIVLSVLLERRAFIVFGALGVFGYLGHLAWQVFEDSLLFPFALTALGLALIGLGVAYQRHRAGIHQAILGVVPAQLLWLLPGERTRRG